MITVEAKRLGTRVIATVKVGIGTGRYAYTVQFADQGSEAANGGEYRLAHRGCWLRLGKSAPRKASKRRRRFGR